MAKWKPAAQPPKAPSPEHQLEAERLRRKFEAGDMLAPFECCAVWAGADLDSASLPVWVTDHFLKVAAKYYNTGPRRQGKPVLPRRLIEMTRAERKSVLPSFDKMAGLVGDRGTMGAWLQRAKHDRDVSVQAYLNNLMDGRDRGEPVFLKTEGGRKFPAFAERGSSKGQFRSEALELIAHRFRIKGHGDKSRARTMRRRFRLEKDK